VSTTLLCQAKYCVHTYFSASCDLSYKSKKYVITIQLYLSYKSKKYVITIQLDLSYKGKKYVINNSNANVQNTVDQSYYNVLCQPHYCVKQNTVSTLTFDILWFNFPLLTCSSHILMFHSVYVITIQLYLSYKSKKYVITIQLDLSYKGKKYVINNSNAPLKYSLVERLDKYISVMQT
jgi:uncharacterized protein YlzI (FlbEa/FlbD family)